MKTLHISSYHKGGAGVAAKRLYDGLIKLNCEAEFLCEENHSEKSMRKFIRYFQRKSDKAKLKAVNKKAYETLSLFDFKATSYINTKKYDLINIHWVSKFINIKELTENLSQPLVFTLHDMHLFLGLAHYAEDAKLLRQELAAGKNFDSDYVKDLDAQEWRLKKKFFEQLPQEKVHIVCPSKWLTEEAQKTFLNRFQVHTIPYGLDLDIFRLLNKVYSQELLRLPQNNKFKMLFVADHCSKRRKGLDVLLKAIEVLDNHDDFELVVMGNSSELLIPGVDVHYLGFIQDGILKAAVYAAADIFIIPSLEDNLPNTVLESIACGTPVIGSNVGGIPDMVRSGVTGDLFEAGNSQDLAFKLDAWMSRDDHELISKNCRKVAEEEYDQFVQAKAYQKLFETILGRN